MSEFEISVIICTRNPRKDHFERVLRALRNQTLPKEQWELSIFSVAGDGPLDGRFDISWHPCARFILEEQVSKAHSLLRGIIESKSNLLITVDDDNVLREDYLQNTIKIGEEFPFLGAWAGSQVPEFEVEPPTELRPHLAGLVIEKRTVEVWSKLPRGNWALPPGAGMTFRKKQALFYRDQVLHDPLRSSLGPGAKPPRGGEDTDLALCSFPLGLGTGMFPQLELTHLIPAKKLTLKSLENLYESFGYGDRVMRAIHDPKGRYEPRWNFPPSRMKTFLVGIHMLLTRKSRAERRIKAARDRGHFRAERDLRRLGYIS